MLNVMFLYLACALSWGLFLATFMRGILGAVMGLSEGEVEAKNWLIPGMTLSIAIFTTLWI